MKSFISIVLVGVSSITFAQTSFDISKYKFPSFTYTLENGLEVVLSPDTLSKNVSCELWIKSGYSAETSPEMYGSMHFLEHVTPWETFSKEFDDTFDKYRNDGNAQVKPDFIRYYLRAKPEGVEYLIKEVGGRLTAGAEKISARKVEYQRERVIKEIERQSKNPRWSAKGGMIITEGTFGKQHIYGHDAYGTISNNQQFRLSDMQNLYEKYFCPPNAILFVTGHFSVENVESIIRETFESYSKEGCSVENQTISDAIVNTSFIKTGAPSESDTLNTLVFTWPTQSYGSSESLILELVSYALDDILEKSGLLKETTVQRNSTYLFEANRYAGQFGLFANFTNSVSHKGIQDNLITLLERLKVKGLSQNEINNGFALMKKDFDYYEGRLGFESSRTELIGKGWLFHQNPQAYYNNLHQQSTLSKEGN